MIWNTNPWYRSGRSWSIYPWAREAWYVIPRFRTHPRAIWSVPARLTNRVMPHLPYALWSSRLLRTRSITEHLDAVLLLCLEWFHKSSVPQRLQFLVKSVDSIPNCVRVLCQLLNCVSRSTLQSIGGRWYFLALCSCLMYIIDDLWHRWK